MQIKAFPFKFATAWTPDSSPSYTTDTHYSPVTDEKFVKKEA